MPAFTRSPGTAPSTALTSPTAPSSASRRADKGPRMSFVRALLLALTLMPFFVEGQATSAGAVFAVGYIETQAKEADAGRAALARYRRAAEAQPGCLAVELFAQAERPGHFAVVETWRDQAAFDGRETAAKRELTEALASIRVSDYDERPYKPLTLAPGKPG